MFALFTLTTASEEYSPKGTKFGKSVVINIISFKRDTIKVNEAVRRDSTFDGVHLEYSYESVGTDLYFKDSVVYPDGTYEIAEKHGSLMRFRYISGEEHFNQYDNHGKIIKSYIINMEDKARLKDKNGNLLPYYKSVHGDTVSLETKLLDKGWF